MKTFFLRTFFPAVLSLLPSCIGVGMALTPLSISASGSPDGSGLAEKEDGGAAVYASVLAAQGESLTPRDLAQRFPLVQQSRLFVLGGGVRGFGVLAEYPAMDQLAFVVGRRTVRSEKEPYTPIALARVFDPEGNLVAIEDFSDQDKETECRVISVHKANSGIWRISFSGGRQGDIVEIRAPQTSIWGVRGEMALGTTVTTPRPAYVWIPPTSKKFLLGIESSSPKEVALQDEAGLSLASVEADPTRRPGRFVLSPSPANTICRVSLSPSFNGAIVMEGAPGLLCPTPDAARRLQGGAVKNRDIYVGGPLQSRIRDWMVAHSHLASLQFTLPDAPPANLKTPQLDVLALGKYGPLNSLNTLLAMQLRNLDPVSPFFGTYKDPGKWDSSQPSWINFLPSKEDPGSLWETPTLAAATVFDSPLNPAYHNRDLVNRVVLSAFSNFVSLEGDDLLRQNNLLETRYPMILGAFVYDAQAQTYRQLKEDFPPDAERLYRKALVAMGDKLADFQSYQSNQWGHMLRGHLDVYMATGEKRFLRYFEQQATAFLDNTFGPGSKLGQHPAGYFLEEYGADGNYDKLNLFFIVSCYNDYKDLPGSKSGLVEKFRKGIQKNLTFNSFFWLLQPDGEWHCPNSFTSRKDFMLAPPGYPGVFMAKAEFPLAARRFQMTPAPRQGIGPAATFSFLANTPSWIDATLKACLAKGAGAYSCTGGWWLPHLLKAYSLPQKVSPVLLPNEEKRGTWALPGLLAWKRGALYGVVFNDVVGADRVLNSIMGGGPAVLWTVGTGSFVSSMRASEPSPSVEIKGADQLTYSCVYGKNVDGSLFASGRERSTLKEIEPNVRYEVISHLSSPDASLSWSYFLKDDGIEMTVRLLAAKPVTETYVNLPILQRLSNAVVQLDGVTLRFETPGGGAQIVTSVPARLFPSALKDVQRLTIPIPSDGSCVTIRVSAR